MSSTAVLKNAFIKLEESNKQMENDLDSIDKELPNLGKKKVQIQTLSSNIRKLNIKNKLLLQAMQKGFNNMSETIRDIEEFPNGDKYEGEMKNHLRNGKGVYTYQNGERYEGYFKDDLFDGKGTYFYLDGSKYEGDWKDDLKDGKGIYFFADGERYEGDFKENKFCGKGVYYYNSGNRYEGDYKDGNKDGKGIIYYKNGDKRMGDFIEDRPIGLHVQVDTKGEIACYEF
jgi:hypothetical protein